MASCKVARKSLGGQHEAAGLRLTFQKEASNFEATFMSVDWRIKTRWNSPLKTVHLLWSDSEGNVPAEISVCGQEIPLQTRRVNILNAPNTPRVEGGCH